MMKVSGWMSLAGSRSEKLPADDVTFDGIAICTSSNSLCPENESSEQDESPSSLSEPLLVDSEISKWTKCHY